MRDIPGFEYEKIFCYFCNEKYSNIWRHQQSQHGLNLYDRTCRLCRYVGPYPKGSNDDSWKEVMKTHFKTEHQGSGICKRCKKGKKVEIVKGRPENPEDALQLKKCPAIKGKKNPSYQWVKYTTFDETKKHDCELEVEYPKK